jgi:putative transposase
MIAQRGFLYTKQTIYSLAGISRQGFMQQKAKQQKQNEMNATLMEKVKAVRKNHPQMGSRSLYYAVPITEMGISKFEQWMSLHGLTIIKRKKRIITTQSGPGKRYPNLTYGLKIDNINQLIVGDITYHQVKEKTYYIFSLKDMYSKRIVGVVGNDNMNQLNSINALNQLFKLRKCKTFPGMIHHTDAGSQYTALAYIALQQKAGIKTSMAENCLENGAAEQLNGVLKNDYLTFRDIKNENQLNKHLIQIVKLINEQKPIEQLGYMTSVAFEEYIRGKRKKDRPIFIMHDFKTKA